MTLIKTSVLEESKLALLKPYQADGSLWLADRARAILGDPPGLGKTRTALAAALRVGAKRILVIGPANARAIWTREFEVVYGAEEAHLMYLSYSEFVLNPLYRDQVQQFPPDVLILDEFHYLKHLKSLRTHGVAAIAAVPKFVWALSGTPTPRNAVELYAIVKMFWREQMKTDLRLTSLAGWRDRFSFWKPGDYGPRVYANKNVDQLRAFMVGKMLRRSEKKVLKDLPEIRWVQHPLVHDSDTVRSVALVQSVLTQSDLNEMLGGRAGDPMSGNVARARHAIGKLKAPWAAKLIVEEMAIDPDSKRVVFAYHKAVLDVLQNALSSFGVLRVDGSSSAADRAAKEHHFQTKPQYRVFLGQNEAAATSMTLTAAHRVDLVEPDWRTDVNVQDGKRVHRIGQQHSSLVRMLYVPNTLDAAIVNQHLREVKMVQKILD